MKKIILILLLSAIFVNMVSASDIFNLKVEIPETYQSIPAGENIWFTTKLINLANQKRIDVTLRYDILDANKQLVVSKSETVAVETQASFVGSMKVPDNLKKGLYFLRVILTSPFGESKAEASFNVVKEETRAFIVIKFSLFDIFVDIPDKYKIIHPGDELLTSIKLINLGSAGRVDVFLDYWITDSKQNVVLRKKETVAVETQANFVRVFDIPKDLDEDKYTIHAKITYADGKEAVANNSFDVVRKQIDRRIGYVLAILIGLIVLVYVISKSRPVFKRLQMQAKVWRIVKKKLK